MKTSGRSLLLYALSLSLLSSELVHALSINIAKGKGDPAHSVNYDKPENAFDGDTNTNCKSLGGWDVKALAVNLGSSKPLLKSVVCYQTSTAPQHYKIQGSNDGTTWTDILRVWNPQFPRDERMLSAVTYRYVRYLFPGFNFLNSFGEAGTFSNPIINDRELFDQMAQEILPVTLP